MPKQGDESVETLIELAEGTASNPPSPLTRELTRVEEANLAFYEAFEARDITRMERVWSRSQHARCIHPGWEPVVGWPDIRQSWVDIFQTMKSIDFTLEDVHVEVSESTAWVNLVAHAELETEDDEAFETSVVATSIFERSEGQWYVVLHHASHFADDEAFESEEEDDDDGELQASTEADVPSEEPN
jgi:ketosteroid isomerase-like protein